MENRIINKWKSFFSDHIFGKAENNMSKIISLFMERKTSKDEIFSLLQLMGGKVHINAPDQVVLEDMVSEKPGLMFGIIQRLVLKMWLQIRRMPCEKLSFMLE